MPEWSKGAVLKTVFSWVRISFRPIYDHRIYFWLHYYSEFIIILNSLIFWIHYYSEGGLKVWRLFWVQEVVGSNPALQNLSSGWCTGQHNSLQNCGRGFDSLTRWYVFICCYLFFFLCWFVKEYTCTSIHFKHHLGIG